MKPIRILTSVEILETRITPSSLDILSGVLTYRASAGALNSIAIFVESANGGTDNQLLFRDAENITLGSGAQAAGFSFAFGGQSDVRGSLFSFLSYDLDLGDGNDTLFIDRLTKPLTADTGAGVDSATINSFSNSTPLAVNGALTIKAETITVQKVINSATNVTFTTDNLSVQQAVNASGIITVLPLTAGREFDLGTENGSRISLTAAEASKLSAPLIKLGDANAGGIFSDAALNFGAAVVALKSGAGISQTGAGALAAAKLSVESVQAIALTGPNSIGDFAGRVTGGGQNLSFTNTAALQIASFAGVTGLSTNGGTITLNSAGAVTQTSSADITTSSLTLAGAGSFDLTQATNHIGTLSANMTGAVSYKDSSSFSVSGITTSNANVSLIADGITINGAVNAGIGKVTLAPLTATPEIRLGAGDSAGVFGVTDAEIDFITAGTLQIGESAGNVGTVVSAITPANVATLEIHATSITASGGASIVVPTLTLGTGGAISFPGANDVDTLIFGSGAPTGDSVFADADGFTLGHPFNVAGTQITTFDVGTATLTLPGAMSFIVDIEGAVAGTGYDQVVVNGTVNIAGATLSTIGSGATAGTEYVIIANDGVDAVTGSFDGLGEGDVIPGFSPAAKITYVGGDGNDVAIITVDPLGSTPASNGKSITFRDVDGDIVTILASKGIFTGSEISGVVTGGPNGAGRFEKLKLGAGFSGANITITAKPSADGGNGFVNLGWLDASGVDLGSVTIAGDLARLSAGTVGGDAKVPALKSLTVQSLGLLGESTLAAADQGVFLGAQLEGALPKLAVKEDLRASIEIRGGVDGILGTATIGGSFIGSGKIEAGAGIGLLKIVGNIRAVGGSISITSDGPIGGITVDGGIIGENAARPVVINAYGQLTAPTKGVDLALKALTVRGSVSDFMLTAGRRADGSVNNDASIGSISVGGDWLASSVTAGYEAGTDGKIGTNDDAKLTGANVRDNAGLFSSIASFTLKGQALGSKAAGDMFGVVAEQIGKAKVGARTFAFTNTGKEAFFAAPTIGGAGAENPMFDFTIREPGSTTPVVALGGENLDISTDGKTATFTDVDGDFVTIKRNAGAFVPGDFTITATASGGGLLRGLTVTPTTDDKAINLSITAKVGPNGGNGFVNVGQIDADQTDLAVVIIGGELQDLDTGNSNGGRPGLGSLTVHSLGANAGTSVSGDEINSAHGIGTIKVATDVRNFHIYANNQDTGNLASLTVGGSMLSSEVQTSASIGSIKIGGSFIGNDRIQATERIGAITVGGDFTGDASGGATIEAFGTEAGATKGPDIVLKSFTVNGTVETTKIILGRNNNADSSIGAISVGRAWIASSALAGATAGVDTFIGTADDRKVTLGAPTDLPRFSSIASITIKGQALGTAAGGDSFGIVAEQIGSAKIGTRTFNFDKGERDAADAFAAAPTSPGAGATPLPFDFFIREIVI